jgi:cyclase
LEAGRLRHPTYASDQFTFEKLADGVWAAIARPGAGASSNCGIVDLGRSSLVFDTSTTPRSARELRTAARILTEKEPLEVVNSHWHLSHSLGNPIFGSCTIRATARTRDLLAQSAAPVVSQVHDPLWTHAAERAEAQRDAESRPLQREELMEEAAARRDIQASRDAVSVRLPDETFTGRYVYPGGRDVMIVEGAGHSESDSVLFVPQGEVMFTGDLVVSQVHPDLRSSDPARWLATLTRIEQAQPRRIVPGHGPTTDVGSCAAVAAYLRQLAELAREPTDAAIPPEFAGWRRPSRFAQNLRALRAASSTQ